MPSRAELRIIAHAATSFGLRPRRAVCAPGWLSAQSLQASAVLIPLRASLKVVRTTAPPLSISRAQKSQIMRCLRATWLLLLGVEVEDCHRDVAPARLRDRETGAA